MVWIRARLPDRVAFRVLVFPVTSKDEPALAIAGAGDAVWVPSSGTLLR